MQRSKFFVSTHAVSEPVMSVRRKSEKEVQDLVRSKNRSGIIHWADDFLILDILDLGWFGVNMG